MPAESPSVFVSPEQSALLLVLHQGLVFLRHFSRDSQALTDGLLFDLTDALHAVPAVVKGYSPGHDAEYILQCFFRPFDTKWSHRIDVPKLESIFREALKG